MDIADFVAGMFAGVFAGPGWRAVETAPEGATRRKVRAGGLGLVGAQCRLMSGEMADNIAGMFAVFAGILAGGAALRWPAAGDVGCEAGIFLGLSGGNGSRDSDEVVAVFAEIVAEIVAGMFADVAGGVAGDGG